MANEVALTAAQIGLVDPIKATVKDYIAGATITKGQLVAMNTDATIDPSDGSDTSYLLNQCKGVALNGGGAGQSISVLQDGEVYGFTVSGLNCGALLYVHDTAGVMSTASGTKTFIVGRVTARTDLNTTNVVRIQIIESQALAT